MRELQGKVAVVTGGASGIGLALARRFRKEGMRVVLGDIEDAALTAAVAELDGADDVLGVRCDVASGESVDALRDATVERFGTAHVVCLNAGVAPSGPMLDASLENWRWVMDVNVWGVVHGMRAFGPLLVEQGEGHIVCTGSVAGLATTPGLGPYSVTKHAVVGLASTLREELAPAGVGVSVLCPGVLRTRIFESERNRPGGSDSGTHAGDWVGRDVFLQAMAAAPGPELAADAVLDAVVADRLFVLPSPEASPLVEQRLDAVRAALPSR